MKIEELAEAELPARVLADRCGVQVGAIWKRLKNAGASKVDMRKGGGSPIPLPELDEEIIGRFMRQTRKDGDCLIWEGPFHRLQKGNRWYEYPVFVLSMRTGHKVHALPWLAKACDIGLLRQKRPHCGNRKCVNPFHWLTSAAC